jgi:hypothetical protein
MVMAVDFPKLGLMDVDKRDHEIESVSSRIEAWISGNAMQRRWMETRVLDVGGSDKIALGLRIQQSEEDNYVKSDDPC